MKARTKRLTATKFARASIYVGTLVVIVFIASFSYKSPVDITDTSANSTPLASSEEFANISNPSVDEISAISLAAKVAETADLTVSTQVFSQYVTLNAKSELAQADESIVAKPQVFEAAQTRGFETYRSVTGDTVEAVAAKYGLSADTIRWANNLTSDAISPDKDLVIPPVDGVVYTTRDGDSVESLAQKYSSDAIRIVSQNDLELSGMPVGTRLIIPGGVLPENERPGYVAPRQYTPTSTVSYNSAYAAQAGNRYSYGYCTWYVYNRRAEIGRPVGSFWGDAVTWAYAGRSAGFTVNNTPEVGAVMQNGGGYGHVAFVEQVYEDGSIRVSEMNYVGWNVVSSRTVNAGAVAGYNFIH